MFLIPDHKIDVGGRIMLVRRRTLAQYSEAMRIVRTEDREYRCKYVSQSCETSWYGGVSFTDYERMLLDGWPEGITGVEGLEGLASDAAERITFRRDVGGAFANIPAHLSGDPLAMHAPYVDVNDNTRSVTLIINASLPACVDAQTALEYAQNVMRLVAWLEAERIETAVWSTLPCEMGRNRQDCVYVTPIREAGQIMQPERLASLVHPAFMRRAWFAMVEYEGYHHDGNLIAYSKHECTNGHYGLHSIELNMPEAAYLFPEARSVILLPRIGKGDPTKAVEESLNLKLRREE
jgi:hypothetical protein